MKYLIFSDLHGGANEADFIISRFYELHCDQMICLGDILYHGPRNDLPEGYAPKKVIQTLNPLADQILAIQGNCDAEVDQMVLNFKIHSSLDITMNGHTAHLEHGHHLEEHSFSSELVFYGHTHLPRIEKNNQQIFLNPGSITIPKGGNPKSYMVMDGNDITLYDIGGNILSHIQI